jgi:adenine-specific DNA-methyltransferase
MYLGSHYKVDQEITPALTRRLRDLRLVAVKLKRSRMTPLQICEAIIGKRILDRETRHFFSGLPDDERHYWIASLYALLMPPGRRRQLAAYFTPPHLARYAIDALVSVGVQPGRDRILDPASGGAAFLVPLAARVAARGRRRGEKAKTILRAITDTLHGVEIDAGLAKLSKALLTDLLAVEIESSGIAIENLIKRANTLELTSPDPLFDAVIGNPPYGRILQPSRSLLTRYRPVITDGYVNLYALFVEQALQSVRLGGFICLIIPMSFIGGPHFSALRKRILEKASVLRVDIIDKRSDVFVDVHYDLCVVVLERTNAETRSTSAKSSLLLIDAPNRDLGSLELPALPTGHVWALPDGDKNVPLFQAGLARLADYGYLAKTGYFVWNREQHRYRVGRKPRKGEFPLVWAHNVRANERCVPQDGHTGETGFVRSACGCPAIIRSDAIILQRTSNRRQQRRLIAGTIRQARVIGGRGFITENHTIIIMPDPSKRRALPIELLCRLLNTAAVDGRFRRMSGSVSISTKALRELPLPAPATVRQYFKSQHLTDEQAAVAAYAASTASPRASKVKKTVTTSRRRRQS